MRMPRLRFGRLGLASRLLILVLAAVLVSQLITAFLLMNERKQALERERQFGEISRVIGVARLLDGLPSSYTKTLLRAASSPMAHFKVAATARVTAEEADPNGHLPRKLERKFQEIRMRKSFGSPQSEECEEWERYARDWGKRTSRRGFEDHHWDRDNDHDGDHDYEELRDRCAPKGLIISIKLNDGRWLNVDMSPRGELERVAIPALTSLGVTSVVLLIVVLLIARHLSKPLRALQQGAEALGRGETPEKLAVTGPREVAAAADAFNLMSERLNRFVRDRTRLLAAISHDLRTPITSLRLRAEFVEDDALRAKILASLEEMQAMTEATLAFAREDATNEETRPTDLSALVESLCEDQQDLGRDVTCEVTERTVMRCRPVALKRALRNVIENAVRYGVRARVSLSEADQHVRISIEDDGPGISADKRNAVFEPFVRLEESRSRETGGVGLGLPIARTIICAHGGDIVLEQASSGGLRVLITLPIG